MSTVTGIQITSIYQATFFVGSTSTSTGTDADDDNDGSSATGSVGNNGHHGHHGFFSSAVQQTLSQLESSSSTLSVSLSVSSTETTVSNESTAPTPQEQALSTFMHGLFAALREQNTQSASNQGVSQASVDSDGDNGGSATSRISGYGHQGGLTKIVGLLQNLAQQASAIGASGQSTPSPSSAITTLQADFQNLMASIGGSSSTTPSLAVFLQSLAQNLQTGNAAGNIVNTKT